MNRDVVMVTKEEVINNVVVKSNSMVESFYSLDLNQQKLILILVSLSKPNDDRFYEHAFTIHELSEILGFKGRNHSHVRKVVRSLNKCAIEGLRLPDGKTLRDAPWMACSDYPENGSVIVMQLNDKIRSCILQLSSHFTRYKVACILHLNSTYSIRIYELLMQYKKIGSRVFEVDTLRNLLGIKNDTYTKWYDFKRRVLDQARKELEEKTDIAFSYEIESKTGKSIKSIKIDIFDNEAYLQKLAKSSNQSVDALVREKEQARSPLDKLALAYGDVVASKVLENLADNDLTDLYINLLNDFQIQENEATKLINDHTKEKLWEKYHYYHYKKSTTEIKNPTAWFINAVIKDYSTADMKQATTIDVDWSDFNLETARLTDLKNELNLLSDILKEAQANLASPVCEYSSALREQYQTQIKDTNAKIADIQNEIKELEHAN
ncbi:replication initiation protein [Cysteiniphilum marinum]|uniref:replication initiation protein n=1 Tax=Cysteiniphilum marinum TaxID=2774191 RepID=UPI00193AA8CC|nr:replication initiation protein [Cysteiniphilum marinum]